MSVIRFGKDIPTFVKNFRREMEWTQLDLANQMKIHPQYVSNVERGITKTFEGFCARLYPVLPRDRREYLTDLLFDATSLRMVGLIKTPKRVVRRSKNQRP